MLREENKKTIAGMFNYNMPTMSEVATTAKNISDYNGAHFSMLPSVVRDGGCALGSREFTNAKSAFTSTLSEVSKLISSGAKADFHVTTAGKQLLLCYYYYPDLCHDMQMQVFISEMQKSA